MSKNLLITTALIAAAAMPATASAAPKPSAPTIDCKTIAVRDTHGGFIRKNALLTPIRHGRVRTIDPSTNAMASTRFTARSGKWLTGRDGKRYALANQFITRTGRADGNLLIAAESLPGRMVRCAPQIASLAFASDTASYASDGTLPGTGYTETSGSTTNITQRLLDNVATRDVCSNQSKHPDGAAPSATNPHPSANSWCYSSRGAGLNDPNGVERYSPSLGGMYIDDPYHRHFVMYSGATVAAAKRPAFKPDCTPVANSPIAWRIAMPKCNIAN